MWELVSFFLGFAVFMLVLNYFMEPKKLIEDIKSLKGSDKRIEALEQAVHQVD